MKLEWKNTLDGRCPYCADPLLDPEGGRVRCGTCAFSIDEARLESIRFCKQNGTRGTHTMWQNLREERCPTCGSDLMESPGPIDTLRCVNAMCTFKIRADRMESILSDESHPANRYEIARNRDE